MPGGVLAKEKKMQGPGQSPGNYREVFKEIAFHASVLLGHGGTQEAPSGRSATCPRRPTAAEEPSRRTTDLGGEPRWIPPAVRAGMAFLAQQLLHATCHCAVPSLLPALVSLPHGQLSSVMF